MNGFVLKMSKTPVAKLGNRQGGFTLLELMIVIVIMGILVAVAVPSYQESVRRSNRKAGAACLLELSQFAERYYTTNLTYVGLPAPAANGCVADLAGRYVFGAPTGVTATTYSYTATAAGVQLADAKCMNLGINQTGAKTVSGTNSAAPNECWSK